MEINMFLQEVGMQQQMQDVQSFDYTKEVVDILKGTSYDAQKSPLENLKEAGAVVARNHSLGANLEEFNRNFLEGFTITSDPLKKTKSSISGLEKDAPQGGWTKENLIEYLEKTPKIKLTVTYPRYIPELLNALNREDPTNGENIKDFFYRIYETVENSLNGNNPNNSITANSREAEYIDELATKLGDSKTKLTKENIIELLKKVESQTNTVSAEYDYISEFLTKFKEACEQNENNTVEQNFLEAQKKIAELQPYLNRNIGEESQILYNGLTTNSQKAFLDDLLSRIRSGKLTTEEDVIRQFEAEDGRVYEAGIILQKDLPANIAANIVKKHDVVELNKLVDGLGNEDFTRKDLIDGLGKNNPSSYKNINLTDEEKKMVLKLFGTDAFKCDGTGFDPDNEFMKDIDVMNAIIKLADDNQNNNRLSATKLANMLKECDGKGNPDVKAALESVPDIAKKINALMNEKILNEDKRAYIAPLPKNNKDNPIRSV